MLAEFSTSSRRAELGCAVFLLFAVSAVFSQPPYLAFDDLKNRIRSTTDTVVLARVDATTVTNQVLRSWLKAAKPTPVDSLTIDQIMALPAADLVYVIRNLGFYCMSNQEALRDKDFVSTPLMEALIAQRDQILQNRLLEREINDKNLPMTDPEARRWYQENMSQYTLPFTFSCHAIFLSTYRLYAVSLKRGDTPPKIAKDVIGEPRAINRILDSRTSTPVFLPFDPKAIDFLFGSGGPPPASLELFRFMPSPKPQEGEVVWIPMAAKDREAVKRRMEEIEAQLRAGADFVALAKARSDDSPAMRGQGIGPLPAPGRPLLENVLDAAAKTPVGQITPILETPHGFLLLKIVEKQGKTVRPFEEVRDQLIADEVQRRRAKAATELAHLLFGDPALKVDREGIMSDGAADNRVIAQVGDYVYTWGDYRRDTGRRYSAPPTYEARVALLESSTLLRNKLATAKAVASGLDREPGVVAQMSTIEMIFRGRAYVEWYAQRRVPLTDDQLNKLYLEERQRFREPGKYNVRELILRLDPTESSDVKKVAARMSFLSDVAKRIKSENLFVEEARAQGNWPLRERQRGQSKTVEENYRGSRFADVLAGLEVGRCAGPFHVGDEVFLLWLQDRSKPRYRGFDSVKAQVADLYRQMRWNDLLGIAEKEIRARHQLELFFTYPEGGEAGSVNRAASTGSP